MSRELQQALIDLYNDLVTADADDNGARVLQALSSLCAQFVDARKVIGRLLAEKCSRQGQTKATTDHVPSTSLGVVTLRFLYAPVTARAMLALLAAVAHDHAGNQRRLVRRVPGVRLQDHVTDAGQSFLYVLTLPKSVRTAYRAWRKRRRALVGHRVPCGDPPRRDGVPAPCYCDDCLGSHQFLQTWQLHFQDLSRWTMDDDDAANNNDVNNSKRQGGRSEASGLSVETFLSLYLRGFQLWQWRVRRSDDNDEDPTVPHSGSKPLRRPTVLFFVDPVESKEANTDPIHFDPAQHVSAIHITAECDDVEKASDPAASNKDITTTEPHHDEQEPELDRVTLMQLHNHSIRKASGLSSAEDPLPWHVAFFSEPLAMQCTLMERLLQDDATNSNTSLLVHVLAFLAPEDDVDGEQWRRLLQRVTTPSPLPPDSNVEPETVKGDIEIVANLKQPAALDIAYTTSSSDSATFSASLALDQVGALLNCEIVCGTDLVILSDASLNALVEKCVIVDELIEATPASIVLRRQHRTEPEQNETPDAVVETGEEPPADTMTTTTEPVPLRGLSTDAVAVLELLVAQLAAFRTGSSNHRPSCTHMRRRVVNAIQCCNERISFLTTPRGLSHVTTTQRLAGVERCRGCRNALLELGKRIRVQELHERRANDSSRKFHDQVEQELTQVLERSSTFDAWETPDPRVAKLGLSTRLWASGVPDPEFFQVITQTEAQNRKQQQALNESLRQRPSSATSRKAKR
ncbi:TPA: hypothetical protein N0F65_000952 [Lagenidium giganteum]|uniref:Uncharacterized protein n=1 Tax=Lagenidium giganteum TaxID=4803 RepID=A0AAV2YZX0_9STRA|nr:TPA: hypothetical protein N0F65_000952 [Lagenidium giganteum]